MHELSITRSLLNQALAEAEKHGARSVGRIRLLLGEGGGVVPDCVQFYFDEMKKGTAAAEAELEFKKVPLRIRCPKCGAEWGTDSSFRGSEASRSASSQVPSDGSAISSAKGQKVGPEGFGENPEPCPKSLDRLITGPLDHALQESLDHSTTGSLDHILQGMCKCNAGGEVISGQELVIESIDVD